MYMGQTKYQLVEKDERNIKCVDFAKNLRFKSYSVIYPSPRSLAVSLDNLLNISQTQHYIAIFHEKRDNLILSGHHG